MEKYGRLITSSGFIRYVLQHDIVDFCRHLPHVGMICDLYKGLSKIASPRVLHFFDPWVLAEVEFPGQDELEVFERTIVGNIFINTGYLNIRAIIYSHCFTYRIT